MNKLKNYVVSLNQVNFQIAELLRIKEELESKVAESLDHNDFCSKTYNVEKFKVTVTTGFNYVIDKDLYKSIKSDISDETNPIKEKTTFEVDVRKLKLIESSASKEDIYLLSEVIVKKPKKLHVKIGAAV